MVFDATEALMIITEAPGCAALFDHSHATMFPKIAARLSIAFVQQEQLVIQRKLIDGVSEHTLQRRQRHMNGGEFGWCEFLQ